MAGLVGAGRTEVARVLFGIDRRDAGDIRVGGKAGRLRDPVRGDERRDRLHPGGPPPAGPGPRLLDRRERDPADPVAAVPPAARGPGHRARGRPQLHRAVPGPHDGRGPGRVGALSGGNQQKVVLAKWLASKPRVLILDEPTRGIDIGAKVEVHRIISELAASGLAIILISSDLPEVLAMSDRILVLHEGRITAEIPRDRRDRGARHVRGDRQRRAGAERRRPPAGSIRWLSRRRRARAGGAARGSLARGDRPPARAEPRRDHVGDGGARHDRGAAVPDDGQPEPGRGPRLDHRRRRDRPGARRHHPQHRPVGRGDDGPRGLRASRSRSSRTRSRARGDAARASGSGWSWG